ncbi:ficolin-2-like [Physella acuta]|uniref:ficolin-2-like n=1 Tax=Physella acuta TaxID=109671 RepID=UPI0027DE5E50|nr:ficolin-2-like [Physella acuta]XP_059168884.1 ficolin-2-like [Physella acuta]
MALTSSKLNIIFVLVFCVSHAQAVCTCEKTPPSGNCVCQSDNSNPAQCKACVCDHITKYGNGPLLCSCRPGYAISSIDRKKCADIDECNGPAGNPCQQICTNTVGSYSCSCSPGYAISSANSSTCDDIDECKDRSTPPCQQICTNTIGSYSCSCGFGYSALTPDSRACIATCKTVNSSDPRPLVNLNSRVQVMCDTETDGGGWIIFQRRVSGTVDFYRNWTEYKNGFGDFISGNFYLGNENIYLLTSNRQTELRVDMIFKGTPYFAMYSSFNISSESDGYRLYVGGFTGNVRDDLDNHKYMKFSTFDQENDLSIKNNCALKFHGAWWYNDCYLSNLNGIYGAENTKGNNWIPYLALSFTEMKLRLL